jgi:hypothetical protein
MRSTKGSYTLARKYHGFYRWKPIITDIKFNNYLGAEMSSKRIWHQSFADPVAQSNYIGQLQKTLNKFAGEGSEFEVHGLSPPDTRLHALTEFRCAAQTIKNSLQTQEVGFDAFVIGYLQEPGLQEIRACLSIPVIGLGEANMLMACKSAAKLDTADLRHKLARNSPDSLRQRLPADQGGRSVARAT